MVLNTALDYCKKVNPRLIIWVCTWRKKTIFKMWINSWKNWLESTSILETTLLEEKNIKIPVNLFIRRSWIPLFRIFMLICFFLYEHLTSLHDCLKQNPSNENKRTSPWDAWVSFWCLNKSIFSAKPKAR